MCSPTRRLRPPEAPGSAGAAGGVLTPAAGPSASPPPPYFEILRQKAFLLGANAILGVDIDYSQFGNKEERMLICMAGTAVNLTNLSELSNDFAEKKKELENNQEKLNKLKEHSKVAHLK